MEEKKYIGKKEYWTYAVAAGGQGMIYAIMSSYISDFYLNVMGLNAIFVMLLMLLARLWDAVNDPVMGIVVDRYTTKWGKYRPYVLFTPIPVAILTMLLFFAPNISMTAKMVYAAITYVAWGMIYTVSDVPFWSLPNAMTPNPKERASILSMGRTVNGVGSAIPMAIVMGLGWILPLFGLAGGELEKTRYLTAAAVASVIGNLLFITAYFTSKERVQMPAPVKTESQKGVLKQIFKCKPLMLVVIMGVLSSTRYLLQAGAIHVARYTFYIGPALAGLDDAAREAALQSNISTISLVFSISTAVGMFGSMLLMPKLYKKFNYKQILIATNALGIVSSVIMFFIGYDHFWALVPFLIISSIPLGSMNVVSYAMIGDSLDYMEWKTGKRSNGLGNACQSFVNKLGNALSTTFIVVMYIILNIDLGKMGTSYTVNPTELEHGMRQGMFLLVSLLPAAGMLLSIIPVFFYDLVGEKKEKIERELQERRLANGTITEG